MDSLLAPTAGTALTIDLSECLRVTFGTRLIGMAETIYGLAFILVIIFLRAGGGPRRASTRATGVLDHIHLDERLPGEDPLERERA